MDNYLTVPTCQLLHQIQEKQKDLPMNCLYSALKQYCNPYYLYIECPKTFSYAITLGKKHASRRKKVELKQFSTFGYLSLPGIARYHPQRLFFLINYKSMIFLLSIFSKFCNNTVQTL